MHAKWQGQGLMCGRCRAFLDEALCARCASQPETKRRVYMSFFHRSGWTVNFLEADLKTPVGRVRSYRDAEAVRGMARRGGAFRSLADEQGLEEALKHGRGGIYLDLTPQQYARLRS